MKKRIITFLIEDSDLDDLDKLVKEAMLSRSNYIRIIIKKYLQEIGHGTN